jgi:hypothetical protein
MSKWTPTMSQRMTGNQHRFNPGGSQLIAAMLGLTRVNITVNYQTQWETRKHRTSQALKTTKKTRTRLGNKNAQLKTNKPSDAYCRMRKLGNLQTYARMWTTGGCSRPGIPELPAPW